MKTFCQLVATIALVFTGLVANAEEAPDSLKQLAASLRAWGENPILISAVKAQNAESMTLDVIKDRDAVWRKTSGIDNLMKGIMENTAAKELSRLEKSEPYYFKLFLMDNQGANVAMTNKTSDYWQGDEAKFTESFHNGLGAIHISDVEFDESAQAYLVQISVPVMDGSQAIGALTIGVNVDTLEGQ